MISHPITMSTKLSETATLYEFFSLLAAGKHNGNARDEFVPVLKKMDLLSRKENIMQSLGKDCTEVSIPTEIVKYFLTINKNIISLSTADWPPVIAPNMAEICIDQKAVPSTTTPPSFTNDTLFKTTETSTRTSMDEEMPMGYPPVIVHQFFYPHERQ